MIALVVLWLIVGGSSFIFWWTREFDLTASDIILVVLAAIVGPLSFIVGSLIHGKERILIKRRKTNR